MKKLNAKEVLIPAVSLLVICVVVTALLAVTNAITSPKIDSLSKETQEKTKKIVLNTATSFSEEKTVDVDGTQYKYFSGANDSEEVGYVFLTSSKGYGGEIGVMVGVNMNGAVTGVQVLSINETAGLGMNAKNESFLSQFVGKAGQVGVAKSAPSETEIQALTGATITSKAMANAVNDALSGYNALKGGTENG